MAAAGPMSPCINVCSLDEWNYCRGCLRSRDEITDWIRMTPERQWAVIRATEERRRLLRAASDGKATLLQHQETK